MIMAHVEDRKTLASVCSASKFGKKIATPLLYKSLGIADENFYTGDKVFCGEETLWNPRSLQLQCRTLIENRELAKHVLETRQYINDHVFRHQHGRNIVNSKKCRQVLAKRLVCQHEWSPPS